MIASVSNASVAHFGTNGRYGQGSSQTLDPRQEKGRAQTGLYGEKEKDAQGAASESKGAGAKKLTPDEQKQVEDLKARDAEVRAHEQAHMAAAGSLAMGGPNYVYQLGPDGKNYAIGGNVKIDTSPGRTPEETIRKAQAIRSAALAPADPSGQDLKVASAASSMEQQATQKKNAKASEQGEQQPAGAAASFDSESDISDIRQLGAATSAGQANPTGGPGAGIAKRIASAYQISGALAS
ncbi:putative metalloprotease CJM1_0395 family protein [Pelagicoccus sp. SDUM812003]|uniref:putative metalloprotease CJM1_0395 family protein n=1 Tax=Pelagicoccus sp. SDUM812003 TaxID=3041267 RepID=UPI00280D5B53|nr:putative metalloprotease CJM1_0395 family protein [Pelagicoccus sp. SDUM812003]MDQ8201692.1 putative metalloprotease CJM1_0395 family protein [Pelagicoccus sp. SDUM812003]